ncbi:NfeD family protein [Orbus sturtevantii]|uniref:NfeD family protein n=1 Tax=Orbus sturtevantii TaxID=3074109 RepID=UPI00370D215E
MTEFLSVIHSNPHWIFIALGGILLIIELLGTAGYSLWSGISAFIVGLIAWIIPLSWPVLWVLFAIFTLATAYIWWLWLKKHDGDKAEKGTLNQPQRELIGIRTVVVEPIKNGYGRVKIKDGTWSATCNEDLHIGQRVEVIAVDGLILKVIKIA